jgi:hypothetical protein
MATMVEVLNNGSGQSAATSDKFPNHVLTGRYAAGFTNVWDRFAAAESGVDFTRIFPFVEGS